VLFSYLLFSSASLESSLAASPNDGNANAEWEVAAESATANNDSDASDDLVKQIINNPGLDANQILSSGNDDDEEAPPKKKLKKTTNKKTAPITSKKVKKATAAKKRKASSSKARKASPSNAGPSPVAAAAAIAAASAAPQPTPPNPTQPGRASKGSATSMESLTSTARKKGSTGSEEAKPRIRVGHRVKVVQHDLYHMPMVMKNLDIQKVLEGQERNRNYYGTVVEGKGNSMWVVTFDALPGGLKVINCLRNKIKLMSANEEEAEFDHTVENLFTLQEKKKKQKNPAEESSAAFCSMGDETISSSTTFCHDYGKGKEDFVKWTILPDSEQITEDPMPPPDEPKFTEMMDDVPWSADAKEMDYNDTFFKVFFPSIEGHGEILNKWAHHADNAKWKTTVENNNINFHTPDHPLGPDWKIRLCYTLMIAACSSVETGIEDLFKRGESDTWIPYPDFGQWIDRTDASLGSLQAQQAFEKEAPATYYQGRSKRQGKKIQCTDLQVASHSSNKRQEDTASQSR